LVPPQKLTSATEGIRKNRIIPPAEYSLVGDEGNADGDEGNVDGDGDAVDSDDIDETKRDEGDDSDEDSDYAPENASLPDVPILADVYDTLDRWSDVDSETDDDDEARTATADFGNEDEPEMVDMETLEPLPAENVAVYPQEDRHYFATKHYVRNDKYDFKVMLGDQYEEMAFLPAMGYFQELFSAPSIHILAY
jgi:hypothetical protein